MILKTTVRTVRTQALKEKRVRCKKLGRKRNFFGVEYKYMKTGSASDGWSEWLASLGALANDPSLILGACMPY